MLSEFISKTHIEKLAIYKNKFSCSKPFNNLSIPNFLDEKLARKIKEVLKKEDYYIEENDLYKFGRTIDFKHINNSTLKELRNNFLSEEFISYIENLTNTKLKRNKIDLHSIKLLNTHYLLCHDDDVLGRKIAFILNLSENWNTKDGGNLELFQCKNNKPFKVHTSITPKLNQFNIFIVEPNKSFHQISEVLSNKQRISISGWFHYK